MEGGRPRAWAAPPRLRGAHSLAAGANGDTGRKASARVCAITTGVGPSNCHMPPARVKRRRPCGGAHATCPLWAAHDAPQSNLRAGLPRGPAKPMPTLASAKVWTPCIVMQRLPAPRPHAKSPDKRQQGVTHMLTHVRVKLTKACRDNAATSQRGVPGQGNVWHPHSAEKRASLAQAEFTRQ